MHFSFPHVLVIAAVAGSVLLMLQQAERLFALVALIASGVEALLTFHVMTLSLVRFRIDVILAAVLGVAGAICWARSSGKWAVTAATVVTLVGAIQVLGSLGILGG